MPPPSGSALVNYSEFYKHIPDIYLTECQLNKANTSHEETPFLHLNSEVIDNNERLQQTG